MELQGTRDLHVTRQQAWDALIDPAVLQRCIPGCESMVAADSTHFDAVLALRIGPVAAKFKGKMELRDIVPPDSATITFDGQGGVAGFGKGESQVRLSDRADGASGCTLHYTVQASVGGKVAQVGQRLIDGAARSLAEGFFKRFDEEMQTLHPPSETPPPVAAVPAKARPLPWPWIAAAVVAVLILLWMMRSHGA
ncbi:CoxG family protein [Thiomonas intermedia]|uniref:CoxG family protein n=1 Tax=Thiomonas intermedia TaxID=926 RepID=UPI0009A4888E|nr:carbon monoxide dehydrogenase subunit G [Thiomonas intermedia]